MDLSNTIAMLNELSKYKEFSTIFEKKDVS